MFLDMSNALSIQCSLEGFGSISVMIEVGVDEDVLVTRARENRVTHGQNGFSPNNERMEGVTHK